MEQMSGQTLRRSSAQRIFRVNCGEAEGKGREHEAEHPIDPKMEKAWDWWDEETKLNGERRFWSALIEQLQWFYILHWNTT